jgi:hypothetical protein
MAKRPTPERLAADLSVPERVLLFCLASGTDWVRAGVTRETAQHLLIRNLIDRDPGSSEFVITPEGRAALAALLKLDEKRG